MSKRGLLAGISIATNTPTPPMKKYCRLVVANLLLVSVQPSPSSAQSDSATKPQPRLCWRGKPAPECTAFWITEFGYDAMQSWTQHTIVYDYGSGYSTTETRRDFGSRAVWTIGPMFNTRPLGAVGGTLSLSFVPGGYRTAVEARRRWWGPLGNSFDLSAGLLQMNVQHRGSSAPAEFGLTAGAYTVGGDIININGRTDLLLTGGRVRVGTSLGVGLGSYAAAGGMVALGALFWLLLATYHD